jgi:hypothetical protein
VRTIPWLVALWVCSPAHADDRATSHDDGTLTGDDGTSITARGRLLLGDRDQPLLHLDDVPRVDAEAGATTDHQTYVLDLGHGALMAAKGTWWTSTPTSPLGFDAPAHGWRAAYELSYDLGLFRIGATAEAGHVDTRWERGSYRVVGLSAYRTFRLSPWMLAWISLGVEAQQWVDPPPPGEANHTTIKLSVGTTFR